MPDRSQLTTDDIARAAGVSRYTVSRVLNNRGGVTQKTVDRIRSAMNAIGYKQTPGEARRGPKPKPKNPERSHLVLFAAFGYEDSVLRSNFYNDLSLTIEQALTRKGCGMITQRFLPGSHSRLNLGQADGAIFLGVPPVEIYEQTKPMIQVVGEIADGEGWDHVTYDDYQIGVLAANYLIGQGHRHTALFGRNLERPRLKGFIDTMRMRGQEPLSFAEQPSLVRKDSRVHEIDLKELNRRLDRILAANPRPTGLYVYSDFITVALYSALYARGVIPGKDLDVISCNNERSLLKPLVPRPPSIDLHLDWIGRNAVERLLYRMQQPMDPVAQFVCRPTLSRRPSV